MYNRTPAYDVLAATLGLNPDATPLDPKTTGRFYLFFAGNFSHIGEQKCFG
jgi:hypothetical protein